MDEMLEYIHFYATCVENSDEKDKASKKAMELYSNYIKDETPSDEMVGSRSE